MAWPPNPNKQPNNNAQGNSQETPQKPIPPQGQEWKLLEKALMASINEQKRARRWGVFFKLLTFAYIIFIIVSFGRSCSTSDISKPSVAEPHLAIVEVNGKIASDADANAYDINRALTEAFENPNAKAVAMDINSPGGSPVQSDEVWQNAMELRKKYPNKKLYAVIGDIGASGAYYIASSADEIWVNKSSLVGSIGVIMPNYDIQGLMQKVGVTDRTMTAGEYKDILSLSRDMTQEEREHIQALLNATHQNFIDAVEQGRGNRLKNTEENKIFTGLFWTGGQSIELGLADKIGGISQLEQALNLKHSVSYSHVDPMRKVFDRLGIQMGKGLGEGVKLSLSEETPAQLR